MAWPCLPTGCSITASGCDLAFLLQGARWIPWCGFSYHIIHPLCTAKPTISVFCFTCCIICTFVTPPSSLWPALSTNLCVYCCVLQSFSRLYSEELPSQQGILSLKVSSCCCLGCWHSGFTAFAACTIHSQTPQLCVQKRNKIPSLVLCIYFVLFFLYLWWLVFWVINTNCEQIYLFPGHFCPKQRGRNKWINQAWVRDRLKKILSLKNLKLIIIAKLWLWIKRSKSHLEKSPCCVHQPGAEQP